MKRTIRHPRRGYLLIEMLVIIGIMSIAIFVEVKLYRTTMHIVQSEPQNQKQLMAMEQLVRWLRKDVWAAQNIAVSQENTVTLTHPGNRNIEWKFAETDVTRSERSGEQEPLVAHFSIPIQLVPQADGPRLVVIAAPDSNSESRQMFTSQLMLGGGVR